MKIIISPAKKMNIQEDHPFEVTTPVFLEEAKEPSEPLEMQRKTGEKEYGRAFGTGFNKTGNTGTFSI